MPTTISKKLPSSSWVKFIISAGSSESPRHYQRLAIALLFLFTIVAIISMNVGLVPINAIPWDVLLILDGGWRIFDGQIPHVDYYNPIGLLTYLLTAIGMNVGQPSASSVAYGNTLLFVILIPWAWFITRSRLSAIDSFLVVVFLGFLLIAPRALGFNSESTTYAMLYNRQGFVLFSMLALELFVAPRASVRHKFLLSGLSCGLLLGLIFFCKVSYFIIALFAVFIQPFLFGYSSAWLLGSIAGFALSYLAIQVGFHFDFSLSSYLADIQLAGKAQSLANRGLKLKEAISLNWLYICLTFVPLLLTSYQLFSRKPPKAEAIAKIKIWAIAIFIVSSGVVLCSANAQEGKDIPLFFIAGVIILAHLQQELQNSERSRPHLWGINYLLGLAIVIPILGGTILVKDVHSFVYAANWHQTKLPSIEQSDRFQSTTLQDFVIPKSTETVTVYWKSKDVIPNLNEGINLLKKHVKKDSKVLSMTYTNPFPLSLKLPAPKGTALWWDKDYSFTEKYYPDPEKVFQDTDIVMIPKLSDRDPGCCVDTHNLMKKLYQGYLQKNFRERESSPIWTLLERR
jgi:hypothetical protein